MKRMETYQYTVVIEPDEDVYHAFVPALLGCHTFGATVDEARANIIEAMALHIEAMLESGEPIPVEREPLFGFDRLGRLSSGHATRLRVLKNIAVS